MSTSIGSTAPPSTYGRGKPPRVDGGAVAAVAEVANQAIGASQSPPLRPATLRGSLVDLTQSSSEGSVEPPPVIPVRRRAAESAGQSFKRMTCSLHDAVNLCAEWLMLLNAPSA